MFRSRKRYYYFVSFSVKSIKTGDSWLGNAEVTSPTKIVTIDQVDRIIEGLTSDQNLEIHESLVIVSIYFLRRG